MIYCDIFAGPLHKKQFRPKSWFKPIFEAEVRDVPKIRCVVCDQRQIVDSCDRADHQVNRADIDPLPKERSSQNPKMQSALFIKVKQLHIA